MGGKKWNRPLRVMSLGNEYWEETIWGQSRLQWEGPDQWRWNLCIGAFVNNLTLLTLLTTWIFMFVMGEGITGFFYFIAFFLWSCVSGTKVDFFVRFIFIFFIFISYLVFWLRYAGITSNYVEGYFGLNNFVPPCGQSACTREITPPTNDVPYNALGYFNAAHRTVESLNMICPVADCFWGPPILDLDNPQIIQTYGELGDTGLPDFNVPCNQSNIGTCAHISTTRPQDYVDSQGRPIVGIGVTGGAYAPAFPGSSEVGACNNINNPPGCVEAALPDKSNLVCTQCSSYFAQQGLLPEQYLCCGPVRSECVFCPGGWPLWPGQTTTILTLEQLSLALFVFLIIQSAVLLTALINVFIGEQENAAAKTPKNRRVRCRPGAPPWCLRRSIDTIEAT